MPHPVDQPATSEIQPPVRSLKQRVLRGSAWTVGGFAASQVIRLGSNLIVSRLLFPEAFGLMALVFTFLTGLEMLSDLGIGPNIIQSDRGEDPKFLNTAWMLSIARSVVLWLLACLLAYPVSRFYNQPILLSLLPIVGLTTLMQGFTSTKWMLANRQLKLEWLTVLDLTIQLTGVTAMVSAAVIVKAINAPQDLAVWALVVGSVVGCAMRVGLSHWVLPGPRNRWEWDPVAFQELQQFGRWIFVSTLFTFFALQGSNLIIPRILGVGFLGVYSFANNLSQVAAGITGMINSRVLYPSYAELVRDRPEHLKPLLKRARLVLNGVNWAISLVFILFGKTLIGILYDERYADAGWILQILSVGTLVSLLGATYGNVLLAQGKTFLMSVLMGIQVVLQIGCMVVGYRVGGEQGVIAGISAVGWLLYPFQAVVYHRLQIWQPEVDLPLIALATIIAGLILGHLL